MTLLHFHTNPDLGKYDVRPPSSHATSPYLAAEPERQTGDNAVSSGSISTEGKEDTTALPAVAIAKDSGKRGDDMPVSGKTVTK